MTTMIERLAECSNDPEAASFEAANTALFAQAADACVQAREVLNLTLPLLIRLGDFIANRENRCEVILKVRETIELL